MYIMWIASGVYLNLYVFTNIIIISLLNVILHAKVHIMWLHWELDDLKVYLQLIAQVLIVCWVECRQNFVQFYNVPT